MRAMKVLPGETSLRLEVFRPGISFSWKEVSFQALSLDFTQLATDCAPVPSGSGRHRPVALSEEVSH